MTIGSTTTKQAMLGDGTTRSWPFTFRAWTDEVRVIVADAAGLETDVTALSRISLKTNGGTVVYPADAKTPALPPGHRIVIMRAMDFVQETRLINVTRFDPQVIEDQLDRLIANDQQLQEQVDRALTVNVTSDRDPATVIEEVFQARDRAETAATSAGNSEDAATASAQAAAESATAAGASAQQAEAWAQDAKDASTQGPTATPAQKGLVPAGGTSGQVYRVNAAGNAYGWEELPTATAETPGLVRPDGKSTFVDGDGTLSASGVPLLSISWELCTAPLPGKLNLSLDNGPLSRSIWADAWAEIQATRTDLLIDDAAWLAEVAAQGSCAKFSKGDGSTTFRVPLLRRVYVRAADPIAGLTAGTYQIDTMRPITARVNADLVQTASGAFSLDGTGRNSQGVGNIGSLYLNMNSALLGENYNGIETRPVSVVLTPYMQMYGTVTNAGALDIAALAQMVRSVSGGFPSGGVVMWSGTAMTIPDGWSLCDGSNGTPDLRDKFVVGAGGAYGAGVSGGSAKTGATTLSTAQMPGHGHSTSPPTAVSINMQSGQYISWVDAPLTSGSQKVIPSQYIQVGNSGGNQPHDHDLIPPYYALCYIMKQ